MKYVRNIAVLGVVAVALSACGNATNRASNTVGVGAAQYTPAVDLVASGKTQAQFASDVNACRAIGMQRQANEADRQGQRTLTNTVGATAGGAIQGASTGLVIESAGYDISRNDLAAAGALSGLVAGLFGGLNSTNRVNDAAKRTVDQCMANRGYVVFS